MNHLLEAGLALILAVTLAIKIATGLSWAEFDGGDIRAGISGDLRANGFEIGEELTDTNPPVWPARKAGCELRLTQVSPMGWHRDLLSRLARADERVFYVFRGVASEDQPIRRTLTSFLVMRLKRYAGLHAPEEPVWGVIARGTCISSDMKWAGAAAG